MARAGSVCVCVGSASWPECMCIMHPQAPPLRLHNAMDLCFDTEVVQGSGEQCVPTGGHGLWWPQKTANVVVAFWGGFLEGEKGTRSCAKHHETARPQLGR